MRDLRQLPVRIAPVWRHRMIDYNRPDYYLRREQQQRDLAARAVSPEARMFHVELAGRYARLVEEVTTMSSRPLRDEPALSAAPSLSHASL